MQTTFKKHKGTSKDSFGCPFSYTCYQTIEKWVDIEYGVCEHKKKIKKIYVWNNGNENNCFKMIKADSLKELKSIIDLH